MPVRPIVEAPEAIHAESPALSESPLPAPRSQSAAFFGEDGLRWGWGLLLFLAIIGVLAVVAVIVVGGVILAMQKFGGVQGTSSYLANPGPTNPARPGSMILSEGMVAVVVFAATFIMSRIERRTMSDYGFGRTHRLKHFLPGVFWGVVCLSMLVAVLSLTGFLHFGARLLNGRAILWYGTAWFAGFLLVALFEESFLRGYAQFTLARGLAGIYHDVFKAPHYKALGFWSAALGLSFVFGFIHSTNPGESPIGLLSAGLVGLVFCLSLYRTGSLWWAIGFHASWDWAQSFLFGVADSGTMVAGHLLETKPLGSPIFSGGLTGPEGSIFIIPVLVVAVGIVWFTLPATRATKEELPDSH
jgi:uncharacterized protein